AIRREVWEKVKNEVCLDDSEVHEDIDLAIHVAPYGRIKFDQKMVVECSFRRWRHIEPYFDYPYRGLKLIRKHKQFVLKQHASRIVKKIINQATEPVEG